MSALKRYYFEIREANVIDFVSALSFVEAKQQVAHEYMTHWQQINWLAEVEVDATVSHLLSGVCNA